MRRFYLPVLLALLCAQGPAANFPPGTFQNRAPLDAGSVAPTILTLTSPNDFSNAAWTKFNVAVLSTTDLAPDGTNTASQILNGGSPGIVRQTLGITLTTGIVYQVTGYTKSLVAPVWMELFIFDGTADTAQAWANTSTGVAGTTGSTAGAVVDTWTSSAVANGYAKTTMTFHFTSTPTSANLLDIRFVDADGGTTPTVGQTFDVWGWGCNPCSP